MGRVSPGAGPRHLVGEPVVVGRDEITPEVYESGGLVVGVRGDVVVLVSFEPGGRIAWCLDMDAELAETIAASLLEHAGMARRG